MKREYFLKSYYAAAFLLMQGIEPERIETNVKGQRVFWYERHSIIESLVKEFFEDEALQAYIRSMIEMKKLMYSAKTIEKSPAENNKI